MKNNCKYTLEDGVYYMVCDGEKIPVDVDAPPKLKAKIIDEIMKEARGKSRSQKGDVSQQLADQGFFDYGMPKGLKGRYKNPSGNPVDVKEQFLCQGLMQCSVYDLRNYEFQITNYEYRGGFATNYFNILNNPSSASHPSIYAQDKLI